MENSNDFTEAILEADIFLRDFDLSNDRPETGVNTPEPMQLDGTSRLTNQEHKPESNRVIQTGEMLPDLNSLFAENFVHEKPLVEAGQVAGNGSCSQRRVSVEETQRLPVLIPNSQQHRGATLNSNNHQQRILVNSNDQHRIAAFNSNNQPSMISLGNNQPSLLSLVPNNQRQMTSLVSNNQQQLTILNPSDQQRLTSLNSDNHQRRASLGSKNQQQITRTNPSNQQRLTSDNQQRRVSLSSNNQQQMTSVNPRNQQQFTNFNAENQPRLTSLKSNNQQRMSNHSHQQLTNPDKQQCVTSLSTNNQERLTSLNSNGQQYLTGANSNNHQRFASVNHGSQQLLTSPNPNNQVLFTSHNPSNQQRMTVLNFSNPQEALDLKSGAATLVTMPSTSSIQYYALPSSLADALASPSTPEITSSQPFVIQNIVGAPSSRIGVHKEFNTSSFPTTLEPRPVTTMVCAPQQIAIQPGSSPATTYLVGSPSLSNSAVQSPPMMTFASWPKIDATIISEDLSPPSVDKEPQSPVRERRRSSCSVYGRASTPSPVNMLYTEQKYIPLNYTDDLPSPTSWSGASPKGTPRPSPRPTPPPAEVQGRESRTGKRSRPQTPSHGESDNESDKDSLVLVPMELKPRLEELEDEEKYNKRKRSAEEGEKLKKDSNKFMLDELQRLVPHIGNPDEDKVSQAGILCEGADYIRSLKREINAVSENIKAFQSKISQLNAEIEAHQMQLPEHGSPSIHRIVSSVGKSIPDMFADHVRRRTQTDWRYWVFTSIMGHFVHTFAQEVSNISPSEMEGTAISWVQERMSLQALRKDAFRKLAKLCSKTSIMEDPKKLPGEARGFVALEDNQNKDESDVNEVKNESGIN